MLHSIKSVLPHRMKRQVRELFMSSLIVSLALAMVMIFEPIYLYKIGYSLQNIMLFYLITYALYFVLMPLGGKFARRYGYEIGMLIGTFLYIGFYVSLFFIAYVPWLFYLAPALLAVQKTFYWTAYHANFARYSDDEEEGREIGAITVVTSLVYIIGPVLAGFIISQWGFGALFMVSSVIFLASNIPTLITKEKWKPRHTDYKKAYTNLFAKKNRKSFLAYLGFGEELIVLVVWPVFISLVISDILDIGLVVTVATLITTLLTLYIGKLSDKRNKRKILRLGSAFYAIAWFVRIFIFTKIGIFFVDTMSRLGKNTIGVPLMAITYENAKSLQKEERHSVMDVILFFEMSLVVGKITALVLIFVLTAFVADEMTAFQLTFVLAGGMSLLYLLL
jgi:MFS family permease